MTTATLDGIRLTLRPYQVEALDRVATAERRGVRKQLGVAATGLGKTVMFSALAEQRGARTLVLVHRDELVNQAVAKMREVWPGVHVGIVKAKADDVDAQVVVASVQTLSRQSRLDRLTDAYTAGGWTLNACRPFDLIVVDEAHHAHADTYRRVLTALDAGEPDGPLLLGVTATPDRGDGHGLDDLFDEITWSYDILWGIGAGYLADVRGMRVVLQQLDMGNVKVSRGDYDAGSAGRAIEDAEGPLFIVKAWREHAADRQTLVFTPTVALAQSVAEQFQHEGIRAEWVSGATPLDERRAILARYAAEATQVLVNCAVLTEGYDNPRTDCIVVARPTKSRALFTQMIGRGTRKHPAKTDLLVLDVVGASAEHSLVTVPSLFGIDVKEYPELHDGTGVLTDVIERHNHQLVLQGKMRAEEADLFHRVRSDGIAWVPVHALGDLPRYHRTTKERRGDKLVDSDTVVLVQKRADDDSWLAGVHTEDGTKRVLIADVSMELAQGVAEDAVRALMARSGLGVLVDAGAPWRSRPRSTGQVRAAKRMRIPEWEQYKTKGEMSDAIDAHIARLKQRASA